MLSMHNGKKTPKQTPYKPGHLQEIIKAASKFVEVLKPILQAYMADQGQDVLYDPAEIQSFLEKIIDDNYHPNFMYTDLKEYSNPLPLRPGVASLLSAYTQYNITASKYLNIPKNYSKMLLCDTLLFSALNRAINHNRFYLQDLYTNFTSYSSGQVDDLFVIFTVSFTNMFTEEVLSNKTLVGEFKSVPKSVKAKINTDISSFVTIKEESSSETHSSISHENSLDSERKDSLSPIAMLSSNFAKMFEQPNSDQKNPERPNSVFEYTETHVLEHFTRIDSVTGEEIDETVITRSPDPRSRTNTAMDGYDSCNEERDIVAPTPSVI